MTWFTKATRAMALGLVAALAGAAASAPANSFPTQTVTIMVPWAPGGTTDTLARLVAQHLQNAWGGATVIVENRPGANGTTGTDVVARAKPDGHMLVMATSSTHVVNPNLQTLPFDPVKNFDPITLVATSPFVLVVNASVEANSVRDLIDLAKSKPGQLNVASYGHGSSPHLITELFKSLTGVDMTHVAYKGSAPVIQALLSGEVNVAFEPLSSVLPHLKSGKLKALGVTTASRSSLMPDLATIAEAGVTGFEANAWYGLMAPDGTPTPVIDKLHADIVAYVKSPEAQKRLTDLGVDPVGDTPTEFRERVSRELAKWRQVIQQGNIKIQ